jgi:hypothetical protein
MGAGSPGGLPDYFALFQSMLDPAAKHASPMSAMLDPAEIEKKIGELEIVIAWLKGTAEVLDGTVEAMKMQKAFLEGMTSAGGSGAAAGAENLAKLAQAMNPAAWAMQMMESAGAKSASKPAAKSTSTARRKNARKKKRG